MTTSGTVAAVLILLVIAASIALMQAWLGVRRVFAGVPTGAIVLWSVIAVPSVMQTIWPTLFDIFCRDPALIRAGQWWRILTSALVHDGSGLDVVLNLLPLAVVAPIAFRLWGAARATVLFVLGQMLFALVNTAVFPSTGAGSSAPTLALAGAAAGVGVLVHRRLAENALITAIVAGGVLLVVVDDSHGFAVLSGGLFGAALVTLLPPHSLTVRMAAERIGPSAL